jgi:hypothetical protein
MSYPGIAAATGTRVDSAAKHTMACRVGEAMMMCWCNDRRDPRNYIHNHKMKFCMHKNDLVLNCGQPLNDCATLMFACKAYPAVVSNLAEMTAAGRLVLKWLYHASCCGHDFLANKTYIRSTLVPMVDQNRAGAVLKVGSELDKERLVSELTNMPYFTAQGYSLGLAYASNLSGDTVGSVLIGGMQTVMNGHFDCRAGQLIQWYFDFENEMFYGEDRQEKDNRVIAQGMRKQHQKSIAGIYDSVAAAAKEHEHQISERELQRQAYNARELGALDGIPLGGIDERKGNIALPKPYLLSSDGSDHYGDRIRVFAKCISGGRKHEMIDIMMMTQSL